MKIAIVGSGVSGLGAAWLLSRAHDVTLYESASKVGGHANTVDVELRGEKASIDTGFIVFNNRNYPNLTALFEHLDVDTCNTEMTFSLSANDGDYEYSGTGLNGVFGQRRNILNTQHWALVRDLTRFFRRAKAQIGRHDQWISLGNFLQREGYSRYFVEDHIVPMGAAIWSTSVKDMLNYPARSFIDFYENHGLLGLLSWPQWRSVRNGSQSYIDKLVADANFEILTDCAVKRVVRRAGHVHITDKRNVSRAFDHVIIASHADHALAMLDEPSEKEHELLGAFKYQKNTAVLHRDQRMMPKRRRLWSSWNYLKHGDRDDQELCVTYWMNRLQELTTKTDYFVTLNPSSEIHAKFIDYQVEYDHPVFDAQAKVKQAELGMIQGQNRTWFCGSYFGHGFHEDGLKSGLHVAEMLGGVQRPWEVNNVQKTEVEPRSWLGLAR